MYGADTEQLDGLGRRMAASADQLERIRVTVRSNLYSVRWHGGDAEHARRQWDAVNGPALTRAAHGLREGAEALRRNAADQRRASEADGSVRRVGTLAGGTVAAAGAGVAVGTASASASDYFLNELFPATLDVADQAEVFGGAAGTLLGGALGVFSVATGLIDLAYDHPYEGNFAIAESTADGLKAMSGGLALAALCAGGPTNPVGATLTGLTFISFGVSYGLDLGLNAWNDWGRDAYRETAAAVDEAWNAGFEAGRDVVESGWTTLTGLFS